MSAFVSGVNVRPTTTPAHLYAYNAQQPYVPRENDARDRYSAVVPPPPSTQRPITPADRTREYSPPPPPSSGSGTSGSSSHRDRPSSSRRGSSTPSESISHAGSVVNLTKADRDAIKSIPDDIPKCDGSGGASKLRNFVDKFELYLELAREAGLSEKVALTTARGKLVGTAHDWWLDHARDHPSGDPARITTWEQLREAPVEEFTPHDLEGQTYNSLLECKFSNFNTVQQYNTAFNRLQLQLVRTPKFIIIDTYYRNLADTRDLRRDVQRLVAADPAYKKSLSYIQHRALYS